MGTKRQRDSNEDDVIKESQKTGSKRQEKMDSYLTKKDSTKINREKSQVHSGEETEEAREKYSKNDLSTPDVKDSDKRGKEKSENERKSKHKYPLDTDSTEIPSKRMKKDESSIVKDKNLKTNYDEYGPKKKHRTNEENRNTSADDFSVNHKELSKKHKKHKKEKKSKHSHKHKHSHKYKSESDKRSKHSHSNKERKSHKDIDEHEHESNQPRPYKEKKSKHSSTDSTESDDSSPYSRRDSENKSKHSHKDSTESEDTSSTPYSRRDSEQMSKHSHKDSTESEDSSPYPRRYSKKKARDSHNDGIPETNATYPERYPEIHSERSHRSFYSSDSEPSPSKIHSERSHRSFYSSDSEPSPSKDSHSHKDIPKKTSNRSDKITEKGYDFTKRDGKESGGTPQKSRRNYSGAEGSSKDEKYNKEDKVQSRKRNSEHIDTSPSIDKKYSSEKKARTTHGCESTPETPQRHLEKEKSISPKKSEQHVKKEKSKSPKKSEQRVKKEKSKSPKKSERKFEETTESSNTDLIERHTKNIGILIESMKGENRIQDSAERIRYLVDTGTLITTRYDFVYFFGMESPFSQFHSAYFKVQNIMYRCAEQYMMHQKAVLFGDKEIAKQIMEETKPLKMKRLGRKVRNFDAEKWGNKCIEVVTNGNLAKFSQNYLLEKSLFDTHPKIMAEASPRDCLWGIGLGASNEKAWNVRSWRGSNLLGYTLMNVRETLMRQKGEIK